MDSSAFDDDASHPAGADAAVYRFAEPEQVCVVPRRGDYSRSAAILGQAAAWYGSARTELAAPVDGSLTVHFTASDIAAVLADLRRWRRPR